VSDEGSDGGKERRDRELIELLNELRVALPGVQVLFAFLLTVPFSQRFTVVTESQKLVYFTAVLCAAAATALLIAPTAYHRVQFREGDKEQLLKVSNRLALAGLFFLAFSIGCVVYFITDVLFSGVIVVVASVGNALLFALLWFVLPVYRRTSS
jgi:Family of unknown function (DUF6328)